MVALVGSLSARVDQLWTASSNRHGPRRRVVNAMSEPAPRGQFPPPHAIADAFGAAGDSVPLGGGQHPTWRFGDILAVELRANPVHNQRSGNRNATR